MKQQDEQSLIEDKAMGIELMAAFQLALDQSYRRFVQLARTDWERLFAGKDPSDTCVSVRVTGHPGTCGSAFLKSRRGNGNDHGLKRSAPGFAH